MNPLCARVATLICVGLLPLCAAGCDGVEADVLSLRTPPDQSAALDLSTLPPPGPDAGEPRCLTERLMSMACEQIQTWKLRATSTCMATGRTLGRLEISDFCRPPMDGAMSAVLECCLSTAPCVAHSQGDDASCRDAATWLLSAQLDCRGLGLRATDVSFAEPCTMDAARYRRIKYQCCAAPPVTGPFGPGRADGRPGDIRETIHDAANQQF